MATHPARVLNNGEEGWCMWQNTVDQPVSPIFKTPKELAEHVCSGSWRPECKGGNVEEWTKAIETYRDEFFKLVNGEYMNGNQDDFPAVEPRVKPPEFGTKLVFHLFVEGVLTKMEIDTGEFSDADLSRVMLQIHKAKSGDVININGSFSIRFDFISTVEVVTKTTYFLNELY